MQFGAYRRPGQLAYYKSTDDGVTFQPWHYYVSLPPQCQEVFKTDYNRRPFQVDTVVCNVYDSLTPSDGNETVSAPTLAKVMKRGSNKSGMEFW